MCTSRVEVEVNGDVLQVRCKRCQACLAARKRAWIGKMLAEEHASDHTLFATFTYAGGYENERAYVINYADLQKLLKRMRKGSVKRSEPPLKFSYVAVGEYGTERNRAHFHVLFFFKGKGPKVVLDGRIDYWAWPHGASQFEKPRSKAGAAVYLMDYLDKPMNRYEMRYSKNPVLGLEYCKEYARRHAREGVALFANGPSYTVPGSENRHGKPFFYEVDRHSKTYSEMVVAFMSEWALVRPKQRLALSRDLAECLEEMLEEYTLPEPILDYMKEHYEFREVFFDWCYRPHTVVGGLVSVVLFSRFVQVEMRTEKGDVLWYSEEALSVAERQDLREHGPSAIAEAVADKAEALLSKAPPRVVRLLDAKGETLESALNRWDVVRLLSGTRTRPMEDR